MNKRKIKFRAWDKENSLMIGEEYRATWEVLKEALNCDWALMQYTGLKDKNGKEIYEGDIIQLDLKWAKMIGANIANCAVGFEDGAFMFGRQHTGIGFLDSYLWLSRDTCEVIGNIYENPELLA